MKPPHVRSGQLRHPARLQKPVQTRDDYGGVVTTWETEYWFHCAVDPQRGAERQQTQQVQAITTVILLARWDNRFTPSKRIKTMSKIFNIEAVLDADGRGRMAELHCQELTE